MGELNSSTTRVVPVFDQLLELDPSGARWIPALVRLATHPRPRSKVPEPLALIDHHPRTWGDKEAKLPAPMKLLLHLVHSVTMDQVLNSQDEGVVLNKRRALALRDATVVNEAVDHIQAGRRGKEWFILEGVSRPDATLEMHKAVIVIEGKRTESATTSKTKWMEGRSQLIRHMDAAMEMWPNKDVFGLLIVEGKGGSEAVEPPAEWLKMSKDQTSEGMIRSSLPHRSPVERERIASRDLGVTTWQAVCKEFGLAWPPG